MNFTTTEKHESTAFPGVSFWVRRLTEGRRIELSMQVASVQTRIDALNEELTPLRERLAPKLSAAEAAKDDPVEFAEIEAALRADPDCSPFLSLTNRMLRIQSDELDPVYVRLFLARVEGLEIDDQPAKPAQWGEFPRALFVEILSAVKKELGLTVEEKKSSRLSGTSVPPADGKTSATTAESASTPGISAIAVA